MHWTQAQRDALAHEYARVGFRTGEQWPYPAEPALTPDEFLTLLRAIPDRAGLPGYLEALQHRSERKS